MSTKSQTPRLELLDVYRGIAVLSVLLFHYTARFDASFYGYRGSVPAASLGHYGVQLFFAISGFCIMLTAQSISTAGKFMLRRVSRIWPALVAAAIFTFICKAVWPIEGREVSIGDLVGSIFLAKDLGAKWVDGAYWSLLVELKFYIAFALLYYGSSRWKYTFPVTAGITAAYIGIGFVIRKFIMHLTMKAALKGALAFFVFAKDLPWFMLGVGMYRLYKGQRDPVTYGLLGTSLLGAVGLSLMHKPVILPLFLGVALLLWLAGRFDHVRVPKAVTFIGLISYPLYLVHQDLGILIIRHTSQLSNDFARIAIAAAGVIALGSIAHYTVEFRFRRSFEKIFGPWFTGQPNQPAKSRPGLALEGERATPIEQESLTPKS